MSGLAWNFCSNKQGNCPVLMLSSVVSSCSPLRSHAVGNCGQDLQQICLNSFKLGNRDLHSMIFVFYLHAVISQAGFLIASFHWFYISVTTVLSSCSWFRMNELDCLDFLTRGCGWACLWFRSNSSRGVSRLGNSNVCSCPQQAPETWWLDGELKIFDSAANQHLSAGFLLCLTKKKDMCISTTGVPVWS